VAVQLVDVRHQRERVGSEDPIGGYCASDIEPLTVDSDAQVEREIEQHPPGHARQDRVGKGRRDEVVADNQENVLRLVSSTLRPNRQERQNGGPDVNARRCPASAGRRACAARRRRNEERDARPRIGVRPINDSVVIAISSPSSHGRGDDPQAVCAQSAARPSNAGRGGGRQRHGPNMLAAGPLQPGEVVGELIGRPSR